MQIITLKSALLCSAVSFCAVATPAIAQDNDDEQAAAEQAVLHDKKLRSETITVLASGRDGRVDETGRAITVITAQEIESLQTPDITQILERAPGVTATRNGTLGGVTSVRVRGSSADQVLVLVDGVRLNDPSSPGGGFDFGNIQTQNIRKLEVLRGANSIIWGSNAIGGVIAIETGGAGDLLSLQGEGGSFGTYNLSGSLTPDIADGLDVSVSGGYYESDGFSSFAGGNEDDGYQQLFVNGRLAYALTQQLSVFAQGRYADSSLDIDGFPAPTFSFSDTAEFQETEQYSGSAGLEYQGERLNIRALYSLAQINRDNFNPLFGTDPGFAAEGRNERFELRGQFTATDTIDLFFGLENEETSFDTGAPADSGIDSAYGLLRFNNGRFNFSAGVRVDDHEQYGTEVTFGADGSLALGDDGWRLRAAYQEGFRAPSLFQLLSAFGNSTLNPETSQGYEIGIAYNDRNSGNVAGSLTLFQRDTDNQIDFISCFGVSDAICNDRPFGTFDNILETRARGIEAEIVVRPTAQLTTRMAYSYIDAENRSAESANFGNVLARQPDHALTLSADWAPDIGGQRFNLGSDVRLVSDSFDNAANSVALDGYALVRVRASYDISENLQLFGRIENAFDVDYQNVANFGTPGQSAFGGIRLRL